VARRRRFQNLHFVVTQVWQRLPGEKVFVGGERRFQPGIVVPEDDGGGGFGKVYRDEDGDYRKDNTLHEGLALTGYSRDAAVVACG
jgi:hypothetical protein